MLHRKYMKHRALLRVLRDNVMKLVLDSHCAQPSAQLYECDISFTPLRLWRGAPGFVFPYSNPWNG